MVTILLFVDVAAAVIVLAALEARIARQLEHRVAGQVLCEIGARFPARLL